MVEWTRRAPYSPVIEIDDDSHSKFITDSSRAKSQLEGEGEDNETKRENFRPAETKFLNRVERGGQRKQSGTTLLPVLGYLVTNKYNLTL